MKLLKYMLPLVVVCGFTASSLQASSSSSTSEINERDIQAVKQHLKTKRDMRLSDKHDDLNISGDIRFEYKCLEEEKQTSPGNKEDQRGNATTGFGSPILHGSSEFGVEFNLYLDYTAERTWAHVHLEFDNAAGISHECDDGNYTCGSGECDQICLRSAYFGYNIFEEGTSRLDVEVGRWDMYALFDSRVQFQNRFDGVLVTYSNSFEDIGDFYVKGGMFVIDSLSSAWGYAAEIALVDIVDIGLDVKYSFVDYTRSSDRSGHTAAAGSPCVLSHKARISQFALAYHFNPEFVNEDIKLYGAFSINHSAKSAHTPDQAGAEDIAWYVGAMIGGIQGEGDWAVDANYQHVEAQAMPDYAVSGIGTGNANGYCYHMGGGSHAQSNTNYQGFQIEGAYALTDNLVISAEAEFSSEENKKAIRDATATDKVDYTKYEIEFLYSF